MDIWWLDTGFIHEKMETMHHFKEMLTLELREQIIKYKSSLLNSARRTPSFSGYYVYKAVLEEGLRNHDDVTAHLVTNGIKINRLIRKIFADRNSLATLNFFGY